MRVNYNRFKNELVFVVNRIFSNKICKYIITVAQFHKNLEGWPITFLWLINKNEQHWKASLNFELDCRIKNESPECWWHLSECFFSSVSYRESHDTFGQVTEKQFCEKCVFLYSFNLHIKDFGLQPYILIKKWKIGFSSLYHGTLVMFFLLLKYILLITIRPFLSWENLGERLFKII